MSMLSYGDTYVDKINEKYQIYFALKNGYLCLEFFFSPFVNVVSSHLCRHCDQDCENDYVSGTNIKICL